MRSIELARKAEISDFNDALFIDKNVGQFDIAVHLEPLVHVIDAVEQLQYETFDFGFRQVLAFLVHAKEQIRDVHLAVFEDQEDAVLIVADHDFFESDDVRMVLQLTHEFNLANRRHWKPFPLIVDLHLLHRDNLARPFVRRLIHAPERAFTELLNLAELANEPTRSKVLRYVGLFVRRILSRWSATNLTA